LDAYDKNTPLQPESTGAALPDSTEDSPSASVGAHSDAIARLSLVMEDDTTHEALHQQESPLTRESLKAAASSDPHRRRHKSVRDSRQLALYADLRREQYEELNKLLETLTRVDDMEPVYLEQVRDAVFHADHPFLLTLVGPFSSGKSSVINAMLGEAILEVGPVPTTDHIAILRYGPTLQKSRTGNVSTVFYPAELLQRLSLVDTPGLESVFKRHDELTQKFLHRADIVFLVMIATQVLTASDLTFMQSLKEYGKRMVIVVNQVDVLEPQDREKIRSFVVEQSRLHLGIEPTIWLVSAKQALTAYTPDMPRDELIWDESGFADIQEYLDETLDDGQRVHQKLETPLQVARNVTRAALEHVEKAQTALVEHRKTVDNLKVQIEASERDRQRLVQKLLTEADAEWQEASKRGGQAIDELFQVSRALGQSIAGVFEIIGLGALMRRFRKRTQAQEAFMQHEVREPLERIPDITNKLGPALEGRDQEEIDQLVDYARQQMQHLPTTLQSKVIGKLQTPMSYDRKALRDIRNDLDDLLAKAGHFETDRIDRVLRGTIVMMAFWMFIVVVVAILLATGAILSQGSGILSIILVLVLAILGTALLPLRGAVLKSSYQYRMEELQQRHKALLERAIREQITYGTQLRYDVTAPFTRLITTQFDQIDQLKNELKAHEQTIIGLQQKLSGLLKD
jgi:tRNA U34 5-carboxymethylaminomethyl modifying GTPase MnmE/TrmE